MRIVFTHNLKLSNSEQEAEFDHPETVASIVAALREKGHEVEPVDVSGPASRLVARLEALAPDLIFNTAEGTRGRFREAFYPALFDQLGFPYTGSDAYVCNVTLDKQFTKMMLAAHGIPTPKWRFVEDVRQIEGHDLRFPMIVKPNFEGSSMGITVDSVVNSEERLRAQIITSLEQYPAGALVEEFIVGRDLVVPYVEGASPETGGVLEPAVYHYRAEFAAQREFQLYDYTMKSCGFDAVTVKVPADVTAETRARAMDLSAKIFRILGIRDVGRIDFRVTETGELFFLEINALPSLEEGASLYLSGALCGLGTQAQVIEAVVRSAAERQGLAIKALKSHKRKRKFAVGLVYSMHTEGSSAHEAIKGVRTAIASYGHTVVDLEGSVELPSLLPAAGVDIVFNMARGVRGRRREAQIPALLELLDIEYVGSDSGAMSFAFDKPLSKRLVAEAGCRVPGAVLLTSPNDVVPATLGFPVILKPMSSSLGLEADPQVVRDEAELRDAIAEIISFRRQIVVAETYIGGREFILGLTGEVRPRVLPIMEVVFSGQDKYPILGDSLNREGVTYHIPADVTPGIRRQLTRTAKSAFTVLGCRDVARVVLRLAADGQIYFLSCTPLPSLTPGSSDMARIAEASGLDYRGLIAEIMAPAMRRHKARRDARSAEVL